MTVPPSTMADAAHIEEVYTDVFLAEPDEGRDRIECMTLEFDPQTPSTWETLTFDAAGNHFIDTTRFDKVA